MLLDVQLLLHLLLFDAHVLAKQVKRGVVGLVATTVHENAILLLASLLGLLSHVGVLLEAKILTT